ncbi:MAG: SDR family NAD(P)-dependent oxidoreductase [Gimesia sp.]|nr:SDR family NAD(P)-dependent oxidoreductase [Gimesia sp.]
MNLSPNKQALLKIRELKQPLAAAQHAPTDEIAIVSIACRFPQTSNTPERFWQSLIDQRNELNEVPDSRWDLAAFHSENPDTPGKMYARTGAFLEDIDLFDADFFGISPREATWVDPQQRLLLETGWESLERAGWTAEKIGPRTGVFIGWMHNDYQNEASDSFLNLNPYIATGAAGSFLSGRLAYYLGLEGPSLAVDTACSSSLVALHLACHSLTRKECDQAMAGGVNVIASPTTNILTCKLKALSPTGQSRAFDAGANGYVRGEGCGVVTLKRLCDAERDGDPILAVIRGSAIGHNGYGSGLTVPNPRAQERVIREALRRAEINPHDVAYLEAHGTGTELGDPIEMQAAVAALAKGRGEENRLLVGSVKTNIGHLEAAAGMAGLIKVLLAMQHQTIPPQLNFEQPNPHIPWDKIPVDIVTEMAPWPNSTQQIAGVSAFGMSGTNAHIVLTNYSPKIENRTGHLKDRKRTEHFKDPTSFVANHKQPKEKPLLLVISAKTEQALLDQTNRYRSWLNEHHNIPLASIVHTAGVGRRHMEQRLAMVVRSHQEAEQMLDRLYRSDNQKGVRIGQAQPSSTVAWQFTGQGSQYVGMAAELYQTQPVFRKALDHCEAMMQDLSGQSLLDVLWRQDSLINHTEWTQPGLFAIQMGLSQLLFSWGLCPDVVLGHSVGQYAAACVAGVMDWEQGFRLICERGRLIGDLPTGGSMAAVFAAYEKVESIVAEHTGVSLAAQNGLHTVISGEETVVNKLIDQFSEEGIRCKKLNTSHAFHSHLMEPALEAFTRFADSLNFQPTRIPLICNVTGKLVGNEQVLDGTYWADHIRKPVRYADSIASLQEMQANFLLEVGPQPVLTGMARSVWQGERSSLVCCLEKDVDDEVSLLDIVAQGYVQGITPDFTKLNSEQSEQNLLLPTYPFQRQRYWGPAKPKAAQAISHTAHPLLGEKCPLAGLPGEIRFEKIIEPDSPPWLTDHEVMGSIVFPGAGFIDLALAVQPAIELSEIVFEQPLRLQGRTRIQSVLRTDDESGKSLQVYASSEQAENWTRCFRSTVVESETKLPPAINLPEILASLPETADVDQFYGLLGNLGLNYGSAFRVIKSLKFSTEFVVAELQTTSDLRGYTIPPTLLDGAFHSLAAGLLRENTDDLFLPVRIERVVCHRAMTEDVFSFAKWTEPEGDVRSADITLLDRQGAVLAEIKNLTVKRLDRALLRRMSGAADTHLLYDLQWQNYRLPMTELEPKNWLIISPERSNPTEIALSHQHLAESISTLIRERGHRASHVQLGKTETLQENSADCYQLNGQNQEHWQQLLQKLGEGESSAIPQGVIWLACHSGDVESEFTLSTARLHFPGLLALLSVCHTEEIHGFECGFQIVTSNSLSLPDTASRSDSSVIEAQQVDPIQSQFWGFGRALGAEHPEFHCRLIDVETSDLTDDSELADSVVEYILNDTPENQIAIRSNRYFVPRLQSTRFPSIDDVEFPIDSEGSYLITGGLGMLGRQAGLWLANKGAAHVVLVSRRPPHESTLELISEIEKLNCRVMIHQADSSSREDMQQLCNKFGTDWPTLKGVIHAAGVLDDGLIADQSWERFEKVLEPKVLGASLLDELTRDFDLDFFVLYSSAASLLGSPGQTNYAAANGFLDGLADRRRQLGLPAISLNWGPWTEGMADNELIVKRLALQGITPLTVDDAHKVLEKAVRASLQQALVLDVDWKRMGGGSESPPLFEKLSAVSQRSKAGDSEMVGKLKRLQGSARQQLIIDTVQNQFQQILSTPEAPEVDRPLIEMGMDSLMAVEFSMQLQSMLGDDYTVSPTMLFDHPTITAIAEHVLSMIDDAAETESPQVETGTPATGGESVSVLGTADQLTRDDIAIIGMSCRFPGAKDVNEFWENLLAGVDSVREVPADRWDVNAFYSPDREPGTMYTKEGGFLDDIDCFDADFFGISMEEACWLDPQHRLLLENCWTALEDAGVKPYPLQDSNVGVFMGIMSSDYASLSTLENHSILADFQGAGFSHSAGVGRISYSFGFEGPSLAIDTASSSSLVAVCQAMRSLQEGHCNMALAGGVNAILTPFNSLLMAKTGMLSPDGRCKSFSAGADGFGRGEGCGVVVLKRLADAERDGDQVLAVVRGGAISHNGFSSSITSPNSRSQSRLIQDALQDARVKPAQVQYLEAHGTGTEYGDPMELTAAAAVFGRGRNQNNRLLVGSVKANISHLEAAGGISGLIKAVLAMRHGVIPPQLHCEEPSPHIPWKRLSLDMVQEQTVWPETEERIAAVTALGLAGTNAHVILSSQSKHRVPQRRTVAERSDDSPVQLLTMSAKSISSLKETVARYYNYLSVNEEVNLTDFCFTAATGRRVFDYRIGVMGATQEEMAARLQELDEQLTKTEADHTQLGLDSDGFLAGYVKESPKLGWVFRDASAQDLMYAKSLYQQQYPFRELVDRLNGVYQSLTNSDSDSTTVDLTSWFDDSTGEKNASDLPLDVIQFVCQLGLAEVWQVHGVEPDVVAGFGIGQYAAAIFTGMLSPEEGLKLIVERDRLLKNSSMTSSRPTTDESNLDETTKAVLQQFEEFADTLNYFPANRLILNSLTGQAVPMQQLLAGSFWREHAVAKENIAETLARVIEMNCELVLEIGVGQAVNEVTEKLAEEQSLTLLPGIQSNGESPCSITRTLASLFVGGCPLDLVASYANLEPQKMSLPTYPFDRKRYWISDLVQAGSAVK